MAGGVNVNATLVVLHIGTLGLEIESEVEEQLRFIAQLAVVTQHEVDILVHLLVGSILAVLDILLKLGEIDAIAGEVHTIVGAVGKVSGSNVSKALFLQSIFQLVIDHHLAVAVLGTVLCLIAELYDGSLQYGFGVADSALIAVALGGRSGVLVVGIYLSSLKIAQASTISINVLIESITAEREPD